MTRNVALIVLDTVRKDFFDEHAPRLNALADAKYESCFSASHYTLPSHASMVTGKLPHIHGVHSANPTYQGLAYEDTMLSNLPHTTVGVSANGGFLSHELGFARYFDKYQSFNGESEFIPGGLNISDFVNECDQTGLRRGLAYLKAAYQRKALEPSLKNGVVAKANDIVRGSKIPRLRDYGASAVIRESRKLTQSVEPFFLFNNIVEAHGPLEVIKGWDVSVPTDWSSGEIDSWNVCISEEGQYKTYLKNYRELYAAAIEYLDKIVAEAIKQMSDATEHETTFIITSDHGDELKLPGESGFGHKDLTTPVLHVPLLVVNAPKRTETELVSHLDLPKLITGLSRGELSDITRKYVPAEKIGVYFCPLDDSTYWNRGVRSVYTEEGMYRWDTIGNTEFAQVETSAETELETDVEIPTECKSLFESDLSSVKGNGRRQVPKDSVVAGQLEDLGYL